jgi:hypothetical protein
LFARDPVDELRHLHEAGFDLERRHQRDDGGRQRKAHTTGARGRHQEHSLLVANLPAHQLFATLGASVAVQDGHLVLSDNNAMRIGRVLPVIEAVRIQQRFLDEAQQQLVLGEEDDLVAGRKDTECLEDGLRRPDARALSLLLTDRGVAVAPTASSAAFRRTGVKCTAYSSWTSPAGKPSAITCKAGIR